jgi:hypothetical protein
MLLKQQHFSVSGQAANLARQHPPVEYVYSHSHPLLQFLPQKLAEWIQVANNYAAELNVPPRPDQSRSDEYIQLDLVSFSPFEELRLRTAGLQLESWSRKEFTGYTRPHLFPRST